MVKDLPDFQSEIVSAAVEATSFRSGLDADKPASPAAGDIWLARDTLKLYICAVAGAWTGFDAAQLVQGTLTLYANLLGGGFQLKNIANPTIAQDAATKAYADTKLANVVEDTTPELGGNLDALTRLINNLGVPVAAADAARKTEVDTVNAKLDDVSHSAPSRAIDTNYQNTSGKIMFVSVTLSVDRDEEGQARIGTASPPATIVARIYLATVDVDSIWACMFFIVPVNWYYKIVSAVGTVGLIDWEEWLLF